MNIVNTGFHRRIGGGDIVEVICVAEHVSTAHADDGDHRRNVVVYRSRTGRHFVSELADFLARYEFLSAPGALLAAGY